MRTIEIINMEKFHPGYLNRKNFWAKLDFGMLWDAGFSGLCEIDKWRFVAFILIQVKTKTPIPADTVYLKKFGMNFEKGGRHLTATIRQLVKAGWVEYSGEVKDNQGRGKGEVKERYREGKEIEPLPDKDLQNPLYIEKRRKEKKREDSVKEVFGFWNGKNIIVHRELAKYEGCINSILENYSLEEVKNAIQNYSEILANPDYWPDYKWSIDEFFSRKKGFDKYLSVNNPWSNFKIKKKKSTGYVSQADINSPNNRKVVL
jgi:hypothetical protein